MPKPPARRRKSDIKQKKERKKFKFFKKELLYNDVFDPINTPTQPNLVLRNKWKAKSPDGILVPVVHPVEYVILTSTGTNPCWSIEECSVHISSLQRHYMYKGYYDIPYSFLVSIKGTVFEGRGWSKQPDTHHTWIDMKGKAIVIARLYQERGSVANCCENIMNGAVNKLIKYGVKNKFVTKKFLRIERDPWLPLH